MPIEDMIMRHEPVIRLGFFFGVVMTAWEVMAPRRILSVSKKQRWISNLGLVVLNSLVLRLLFPTAAIGVALFAQQHGWGLLNYYALPMALKVLLAVLALDFVIYQQHVLVHAVPTLWRLHRLHHADLDYDVTTGARFHPLEIILSMLIKFAAITALGPLVVAVLVFEVTLNAMAMFNHGNVRLPLKLDRWLRVLLVTPDMHRVHHSVEDNEANSNFGFSLALWDRIFGTYIAQPRKGHEGMRIGIHHYRNAQQVNRLPGMLALPFVGTVSGYAINRRRWSQEGED